MEKGHDPESFTSKASLVSVVVTTKNEEDVLGRLLESILDQKYKNTEIVIVDNNSSDSTVAIARRYTPKVYNFGPERSAQRNLGVKRSLGKYVLILDADMALSETVIGECVELAKSDSEIGAIVIPEESVAEGFWEKAKAFERSLYNLRGDDTAEAARFFPKKIFEGLGGYDESITGPEDWDLPERIRESGKKIKRAKARIFHYERIPSLIGLAKKKYYYALKSYPYLAKHKISVVSPKTVYFLRPVFYKNWRVLLTNPLMSMAMIIMLTVENIAGALGFLVGRFK